MLGLVVAALAVSGTAFFYVLHLQRSSAAAPDTATYPAAANAVSALGRLQPEGEIISLSAPTTTTGVGSSRISQLLVAEGDSVRVGQVIAVLDSYISLQASLKLALEEVKVSQADLAKVRAGAPTGERQAQAASVANLEAELQGQLAAQSQTIARLQAEFNNSRTEYARYRALFQEGAVTASELDSKQLTLTTAQEQLNEAKVNRNRIEATIKQQIEAAQATLNKIAEIRPTDVQAAQADVDRAIANAAKAKADLELTYIRSPIEGKVLKIHTRPGEAVGDKGIVALGRTDQMNVLAEVYELDIGKVRVGQSAIITSNALPNELHGTVTQVGLQVNPQDVVSTDPTADVDQRVVEVKIRLNEADSQQAATLTNLQVNVMIGL